jgi:hypothetical protein
MVSVPMSLGSALPATAMPPPQPAQSMSSTPAGADGDAPRAAAPADRPRERFQWWPERLARSVAASAISGFMLPHDVMTGRAKLPSRDGRMPGTVPYGDPESAGTRVADLALLGTPLSPAARIGERAVAGAGRNLVPDTPPAPTTRQLQDAADAGRKAAREMGVDIDPRVVENAGGTIRSALEGEGILAERAPETFAILAKLERAPAGAVATIGNLDAARGALIHVARESGNPAERLAAARAVAGIEGLVTALPPGAVVAGPAAAAGRVYEKAIGNDAAAQRANAVSGDLDAAVAGIAKRAELDARIANTNAGDRIRQGVGDLVTNRETAARYSKEELDALTALARGGAAARTTRSIGRALGGEGGRDTAIAGAAGGLLGDKLGGEVGALLGLGIPALGFGANKLSDALTRHELKRIEDMLRKRSPLYLDALAAAPLKGAGTAVPGAALRGTLLGAKPNECPECGGRATAGRSRADDTSTRPQ